MKVKLISAVLAVLLLITFTGCGEKPSPTPDISSLAHTSAGQASFDTHSSEEEYVFKQDESSDLPSKQPAKSTAHEVQSTEPAPKPTQSNPPSPPIPTSPFDNLKLNCKTAFIIDSKGEYIYSKGEMQRTVYPASITKLYTAYVALKFLSPEDVVTVGDELKLVNPDSSLAKIKAGYVMTVEMLVEGMLLPSGNDAAYSIAAAAGRKILNNDGCSAADAVAAFVGEMNRMAIKEGFINTHFANPDGFHDNSHYSCMQDIFAIANAASGVDCITKYTKRASDTVTCLSGEVCTWKNTNLMIDSTSKYYRKNVVGLKTGFTDDAGYCLITAEKTEAKTIIIGVFGCSKTNSRFDDTVILLDAVHKL